AAGLAEEARRLVGKIRGDWSGDNLSLTLDPGEYRGFEYQTGTSFTLFAKGIRGELGRGGRYRLVSGEYATGFTSDMASLLRALPSPALPKRIYLPPGTGTRVGEGLRQEGWQTVSGLGQAPDEVAAEGRRLGCSHALIAGKPTAL